jgi:plasmid stabilization system protein ParE
MIDSARYYEELLAGFGSDFLTAVAQTTSRITQFPEAGPVGTANIRKRLVSGFPFTILYEVQTDRVFIAAVMHQNRRPGYWTQRLQT